MSYNWGYVDFVKQRKKLNDLIEKETDLRKKIYLLKVADATDKIIFESFGIPTNVTISAKQRFSNILDSSLCYGRYYSIIGSFLDCCIDNFSLIDETSDALEELGDEDDFDFLHTGTKHSYTKTLSLVDKFYSSFDDELYQVFSSIYADRDSFLRFVDRSESSDEKSNGNTIFIDGVKKNFISICDEGNVNNYGCTVHEYGHAIQNLINPEVSYSDRDDFFMEVASTFPELVSIYENHGDFNELELAYYLYTIVTTNLDSAELLTLHIPLINAWKSNKYVMSHKFFREIDEAYDVDDECFEKSLDTTIESEGVYVLSFMVSLELFHIYKKDKKKALELFKSFLKYPSNEDILVFVLENFQLCSNANEEIKEIVNDFNNKLKKRR